MFVRILHRPALAIVISVLLLFMGLLAITALPISQFPSIAPPTVEIQIAYPGASANVLIDSVIIPLEQSINGVQNMRYIISDATSAGEATIRILFEPGTDPDINVVNVQNAHINRSATAGGNQVHMDDTRGKEVMFLHSPFHNSTIGIGSIDPKGGGTSGPFIAKLFERLGVAREMNETGVLSKTGRDVVRAVASGEATLGVTQATELIGAKGVQFAGYVAPEVQVVSVYAGAVSRYAAAPDAARRFIQFLKSPASAERFARAGWSVS